MYNFVNYGKKSCMDNLHLDSAWGACVCCVHVHGEITDNNKHRLIQQNIFTY